MDRDNTLFKMFGKFYPEGTILFKESDLGDEMYYIQDGAIQISLGGEREAGGSVLRAGDILGEDALLQRSPRKVMAVVVEDSRLLVINSRNIGSVVRNGPELSAAIMGEIIKRLDETWREMQLWQRGFFLSRLEVLFRGSPQGKSWTITEVSEETEIEDEGVRHVFDWLVEKDVLVMQGEGYSVKNFPALERLASETEKQQFAGRKETSGE